MKISPSRISQRKILEQLKSAARKGDRTALALAVDQMRTLAYSPRHWERYLVLLSNPLARLVDLLAIKQGEKIARQKGWVRPKRTPAAGRRKAEKEKRHQGERRRRKGSLPAEAQPLLFPELEKP